MYNATPIRPKTVPMTWDELIGNGAPRNAQQPEAYRDVLYDTQTYVDNATTDLTFFTAVNADKTLSNMPASGSLPAATAFAINAISTEWLIPFGAGTAAGPVGVADISLLGIVGRPILTLTMSDKQYGPWPQQYAGAAGNPTFFGFGTTTSDAGAIAGAQNSFNGGFFLGNTIILLPNVGFQVNVRWAAAQNISGNQLLRVSLHGTRYRRVV